MPQESIHEFYEMVRAEKKAAFEVKAEKWYKITIEATIRPGERKTFYTYDVPDSFLNKYDWVFRWRRAKIQCLHPKLCMTQYICPYFKKEGVLFEYNNSVLSKYIAAKARVTRQQKKVDEYLFSQQSSLFFNPDEDQQLQKILGKLQSAKAMLAQMEKQIDTIVREHKSK